MAARKITTTLLDYSRPTIERPDAMNLDSWYAFVTTHTSSTSIVGLASKVEDLGASRQPKKVVVVFEATLNKLTIVIAFSNAEEYRQDKLRWKLAKNRTQDTSYCSKDDYGTILSYPEHVWATTIAR